MFLVFFFNQINPIPVFTKDTQRSRGASSTLKHLILLDNRLISYKTSLLGPPSSSSWASRMLYCSSPVAGTLSGIFCRINTTVLSCGKQITECLWTGTLDSDKRNLCPRLVLLEACDLGKVPWFFSGLWNKPSNYSIPLVGPLWEADVLMHTYLPLMDAQSDIKQWPITNS